MGEPMPSVLVADDDDLLLRLLEFKFQHAGFDVIAVSNGEEAWRLASERSPDLVVIDGMLPGRDGFDVVRQLKTEQKTERIPVILLTARNREDDVVNGLSLGADEYITKPFMPDELLARAKRLLRRPR